MLGPMRVVASLALIASAVQVIASDVVDLSAENFQLEVFKEDLALVEFFAPWCGHCKNLAPQYEEAATELKAKKGIKLAKVDCTAEQALCSEYGVNGYPTLKVFRNGTPTDYTGPRKADGIISYMIKQSLPAVTTLTPESHEDFIKADRVVVVAYGDESHAIPDSFIDYANAARDSYLFGQYLATPLPQIPGDPSLPAIVLYKSFDEGHAVLPSSAAAALTPTSIADFVKANSVPLMDEISPENFGMYAERGLPIAYLFADPENTSLRDELVEALTPIAKQYNGDISFVHIDAVKFVDHGRSLNLPGDSWPAFVIQDLAQQTKFPMSGSVSTAAVEQFVRAFVKGEIRPSIKSQPVPATQDNPVYALVADGWDALFGDLTKDVFAEFFAPWCGHCQRLAPVWETLGERYEKNSNVIIAQMDATENDIPPQAPFRVQGFPTLKFRAAGSHDFIDYNGDRSLESLIEFVEQHKQSAGTISEDTEAEDEEEWEDSAVAHDEL